MVTVNGWYAAGEEGWSLGDWGDECQNFHQPSLTNGVVMVEAGSFFQYFTTLTEMRNLCA